jgi:hypothetical protein
VLLVAASAAGLLLSATSAEVVHKFSRFVWFCVVMMVFVLLALPFSVAAVVPAFRSVIRFSVVMLGLVAVCNMALRKTVVTSFDPCFFSCLVCW